MRGFQFGFTAPLACSAQGLRCGSFVSSCIHRLVEARAAPIILQRTAPKYRNAASGSCVGRRPQMGRVGTIAPHCATYED